MKKIKISLTTTILLLMICFCFDAGASAADGLQKLALGVTYRSFDITGDKKPDTLLCKGSKKDGIYQTIKIYVNGKRAAYINLFEDTIRGAYRVDLEQLTLSNGKTLLYLAGIGDNGDGPCAIFQYQGKKLKEIMDLREFWPSQYGNHPGGTIQSVKGNKVNIRASLMSFSLGAVDCDFTYIYKSGKLKRSGNTAKIVSIGALKYMYGRKYFTAAKSVKVYKNAGSTARKAFTISKKQKVYPTQIWIKNGKMWIKLKVNGKQGWIPAVQSQYSEKDKPFKEIEYAG